MDKDVFKDKAALLKNAIKGEEDGIAFYDLLADRAVNPEARRRLENLRDDEKRHKSLLTNLYRKYVGGEIGALPAQGIGPLAKAFDKGKLKIFKSEMEYISLAIETELAATRFYKEGKEAIGEKEFAEILHQLSEEENSHYEILMAEKEAMAGNYHWFSSDFGAPMED
ncbi:MAG: ferritin family protein [candidate division Zixibacteria bacterium]|jgi:rubrerythrin|nr:ferritin family protein [candidate division Zixibacteria bacterium]